MTKFSKYWEDNGFNKYLSQFVKNGVKEIFIISKEEIDKEYKNFFENIRTVQIFYLKFSHSTINEIGIMTSNNFKDPYFYFNMGTNKSDLIYSIPIKYYQMYEKLKGSTHESGIVDMNNISLLFSYVSMWEIMNFVIHYICFDFEKENILPKTDVLEKFPFLAKYI